VLLVLWLIPWTVFLPQSLQEVPRRWREFRSQMTRRQRAYLLFFLWNVVIVGFFSLSTRQEYYTIPAIPGMALLVGGWLQRERASARIAANGATDGFRRRSLLAVGAIIAVAGFALLFFSKAPAPGTDLSDLLRKNPQDYALSFGHFLDLTPQAMGAFRVPLFGFSLAFCWARLPTLFCAGAGGSGQRCAGCDDGRCAGMCAHCVRHLLTDYFVEGSGVGDSRAIPARRPDRCGRIV
jgi:4-amino-4-deoxy-L-arabinose transferase-like glycosyltransferase